MNSAKRKKLEAHGWHVGTTAEFLGLSEQESTFIELKLKLGENLKQRRLQKKLTQVELQFATNAIFIKSSFGVMFAKSSNHLRN